MKRFYIALVAMAMNVIAYSQEGLATYTTAYNTGITYNSISATGISPNFWRNTTSVSTDDNLSEAIPLDFNFLFDGVHICNVQISTNGFLSLLNNTGAVGTGTGAYGYQNTNFSTVNSTVRTLGVFYEDQQTAGNLSTLADLQNSMKYLTTGVAPNRVFTVEWINMQDFATGSTASLNYQIQLFEGSNNIVFRYGTMNPGTKIDWTYTLGINSRILSATPTTTELWTQQAANTNTFGSTAQNSLATLPANNSEIVFTYGGAAAVPLAGAYSIPGTHANFIDFINNVNYNSAMGNVIVNVAAGSTFPGSIPILQTGCSSARITFQKSGVGANPIINPVGTAAGTSDHGFRMFGVDNLTWDGIDIASNGNNVEFGIFLSQLSDKNGCRSNTFRNFNITLGRTGTVGQVGILTNSAANPALSALGCNENNVFKNFTIKNVAGGGIQFNGAVAGTYNAVAQTIFLDNNNRIINDVCTNYNIIGDTAVTNDFIPVTTATAYGIFNLGQRDMTISNCRISNLGTTNTGGVYGIITNGTSTAQMPSGTLFSQGNLIINNNKISMLSSTNTGAGIIGGISANVNGNAGTFTRIYNNFIHGLNSASTVTTTRRVVGILLQNAGTGAGSNIEVWNNTVKLEPTNILCPNSCLEAYTNTTGPILTVKNNIFSNFTPAQTGNAKHYCLSSNSATLFGNTGSSSNYNDLYLNNSTNGFTGLGNATDYATIANWNTANGQDGNSITINPVFVGPNNLHITEAALNNAGTPLPIYITNDIDCELRPNPMGSNPDLGADEFLPASCQGQPNAGLIAPSSNTRCSGQTYTMTATGLSTGLGISYQWKVSTTSGSGYVNVSGGSGATSSSYLTGNLTPGTYYYVIETICSVSGLSSLSNELVLTVNQTPTASAMSNSPICAGTNLMLTGNTDVGTTFSWTGPNSFASNDQNPIINNAAAIGSGVYSFVATFNGCSSLPSTTNVNILNAPIISASANPDIICSGNNSQLNANVQLFGNIKITEVTLYDQGTGQTNPYPSYITSTGALDFVEVSNISTGPINLSGLSIFDYPSNSATSSHNFTFPNGTILPGNSVSVIHLGSGTDSPANFFFNTGGTSNLLTSGGLIGIVIKNGSEIVDAVGVNTGYIFHAGTGVTAADWTGIASSPSGIAGTIRSAVNDNNAGSDFIAASSGTPQTIGTYNGSYIPISSSFTYAWSPATFLTATNISNPIAQMVTNSVDYIVTVTNEANCFTIDTVSVTVSAGADIIDEPISVSACIGKQANFAVSAVGPSLTYQWKKNGNNLMDGGTISGTLTASLLINGVIEGDEGNYTVEISSSCGSPVLSQIATLTVNPIPTASISPVGPTTICAPHAQTFTATSDIGNVYQWKRNNANIMGANGSTYDATIAGNYKVLVSVNATGCIDSSMASQLIVNPQPASPTASAVPNDVCEGGDVSLNSSAIVEGYNLNPAGTATFIDIDGTGTIVGTVSDDSEHNITMQPFVFNGMVYTSARVGMNGVVALGSTTGDISTANASLPSTANTAGNILLSPYWDDLDIQTMATVKVDTIGSKYIIQFTNAAHNNFTTGSVTFQIQLDNSNNQIHFVYSDVIFGDVAYDSGVSATVGIQFSGTSAMQHSFNTASLTNGQCISFVPNSINFTWSGPNMFSSMIQNPMLNDVSSDASGDYQVVFTNSVTGCTDTAFVAVGVTGNTVMNGNNTGAESLRKVIECANAVDTIYFDPGVTMVNLTDSILLNKNLTIQGNAGSPMIAFNLSSLNSGLHIAAINDIILNNISLKNQSNAVPLILNNGDLDVNNSILKGAAGIPEVKNNGAGTIDFDGSSEIKME